MRMPDPGDVLRSYDLDKITIGTLGSHSALNILRGAKDEGFRTVCISKSESAIIYERFKVADELMIIPEFKSLLDEKIQRKLIENNTILIPHGSFNAYIGPERLIDRLRVPLFGNRELLRWETDREKQLILLIEAGLKTPRTIDDPERIEGLTMVKFPGAKGGRGYFIVQDHMDFQRKIEDISRRGLLKPEDKRRLHLQEYILGVPIYPSYFRSVMRGSVELLAMDRRYESAVDGIGRIPAKDQLQLDLNPTYTVVGNFPIVAREMLLKDFIIMGDSLVKASERLVPPGLIGPFCLETIIRDDLSIVAFEISARIVAGTNVGIGGFPYAYLLHGEGMYMGRRIALEIKEGIASNRLSLLVS
ncbi:MAG: formate--phosphoribosylaminoimidazolecarboxamide ligase [Candidatus Bathyarchaeia archaeon]